MYNYILYEYKNNIVLGGYTTPHILSENNVFYFGSSQYDIHKIICKFEYESDPVYFVFCDYKYSYFDNTMLNSKIDTLNSIFDRYEVTNAIRKFKINKVLE